MQNRKRIVVVMLIVGVLLAFSGAIAHLLPATTLIARRGSSRTYRNCGEHGCCSADHGEPYIIADIAGVPARPRSSYPWCGRCPNRPKTPRSIIRDPMFNFF